MRKKTALPPLAFGHEISVAHESAKVFADLIDQVVPGMNAYDPLTDGKVFRSRTASLQLPKLGLVATSISPTYVDRNSSGALTLMLPFAGDKTSSLQVGNRRLTWGVSQGGVFLPETDERVSGDGGFRSHILWQLDKQKLLETAQTMLGECDTVDLKLNDARLLPKKLMGINADATIQALLPIIQLYARQPDMLVQLGVVDVFYRQSVMLLRPDLFTDRTNEPEKISSLNRADHALSFLCEYIAEHLAEPLYLSDLERISGLSARSLQMAFKRKYNCSPMAWITEQRLLRARHLIVTRPNSPLEVIAHACGFQTMPAFFQTYKQRFGETPGNTRHSKF